MSRRRKRILPANALKLRPTPKTLMRFLAKVEIDDAGHWIWIAHADEHGYGQFRVAGKVQWAHRVAYAIFRGALAAGLEVDHRCKEPRCVNPWHLRKCSMPVNRADTRKKEPVLEPAPF